MVADPASKILLFIVILISLSIFITPPHSDDKRILITWTTISNQWSIQIQTVPIVLWTEKSEFKTADNSFQQFWWFRCYFKDRNLQYCGAYQQTI